MSRRRADNYIVLITLVTFLCGEAHCKNYCENSTIKELRFSRLIGKSSMRVKCSGQTQLVGLPKKTRDVSPSDPRTVVLMELRVKWPNLAHDDEERYTINNQGQLFFLNSSTNYSIATSKNGELNTTSLDRQRPGMSTQHQLVYDASQGTYNILGAMFLTYSKDTAGAIVSCKVRCDDDHWTENKTIELLCYNFEYPCKYGDYVDMKAVGICLFVGEHTISWNSARAQCKYKYKGTLVRIPNSLVDAALAGQSVLLILRKNEY
ncbi:hypothetical protein ElyMa_002526300 [Elysia marginata]|uniref:Sushi domain-containing protein n=1 Tax=Elysia marginata TaxID=1093978 RepID=A0AAV4GTT4_9GAST|nr:hypothetical protein ElyMa_002526300 [Elysia marginata]